MNKLSAERLVAFIIASIALLGRPCHAEVVLVAATGTDNIGVIDLATGRTGIFTDLPEGEGHNPRGIVVAPDGSVFISNNGGNESVYRVVPGDGQFDLVEFAGPFERFGPGHLAIAPGGNLLVAGDDQDRVFRYDIESGNLLDSFASGNGNVMGLALDGNTLYVAEIFQSTIQRFDLSTIPAQGADFIRDSRLDRIFGITLGHDNNLLVSDTSQPFIYEYSLDTGQFLRNFINLADFGLGSSPDIKYLPESDTYVIPVDEGLLQFDTSGNLIATHTHPELSGLRAVTPALNAFLPPLDLVLQSPGLSEDALAGGIAGEIEVSGPAEGAAFGYEFDNTSTVTALPFGSNWKYFDRDREPSPVWESPAFDDSAWVTGVAPLGYGDPFIETAISFGPSPANKFPTAYFRSEFEFDNPGKSVVTARVNLQRDDGAVVYLNGVELFRSNLPKGTINFPTLAVDASDGFVTHEFPVTMLRDGVNDIAVEVHQASAGSSDLAFDLEVELVVENDFDNSLFAVSGNTLELVRDLEPGDTDGRNFLQAKIRVTDELERSLTRLVNIPILRGSSDRVTTVALSGDVAQGSDGKFRAFKRAVLNDRGEVLVEAAIDQSGEIRRGVFTGIPGGLQAIAVSGNPVPDDSDSDVLWNLALNDVGVAAFQSWNTMGHAHYVGSNPVFGSGEVAPGAGGGRFQFLHQPALAPSGELFSPAHLRPEKSLVSVLNDTGLWGTVAGLVAREGDGSVVEGFEYGHLYSRVVASENGQIAFASNLSPGPGAALFHGAPDALQAVARRGDPAPGTNQQFAGFHAESIGVDGALLFRATLQGDASVDSSNNGGLWEFRDGEMRLIAREGQLAGETGLRLGSFRQMSVSGNVCYFNAYLVGSGVDSSNDGSLWRSRNGGLDLIAREGDAAHGTQRMFGSLTNHVANNSGAVTFLARLVSDDAQADGELGVWHVVGSESPPELLLQRGDTVELPGVGERVLTGLGLDSHANAYGGNGGYGRALNDSNHLVLRGSFSGNLSAVVVLNPAVPHIAAIQAQANSPAGKSTTDGTGPHKVAQQQQGRLKDRAYAPAPDVKSTGRKVPSERKLIRKDGIPKRGSR